LREFFFHPNGGEARPKSEGNGKGEDDKEYTSRVSFLVELFEQRFVPLFT
jgi:hypothetical protein